MLSPLAWPAFAIVTTVTGAVATRQAQGRGHRPGAACAVACRGSPFPMVMLAPPQMAVARRAGQQHRATRDGHNDGDETRRRRGPDAVEGIGHDTRRGRRGRRRRRRAARDRAGLGPRGGRYLRAAGVAVATILGSPSSRGWNSPSTRENAGRGGAGGGGGTAAVHSEPYVGLQWGKR